MLWNRFSDKDANSEKSGGICNPDFDDPSRIKLGIKKK